MQRAAQPGLPVVFVTGSGGVDVFGEKLLCTRFSPTTDSPSASFCNHVSATALEETPHETETTQITTSDALRRRAQAVINDKRTDPQWRSIVRYALEINDPWLADIVRRAAAGEKIIDTVDFSLEPQFNEDDALFEGEFVVGCER